MKKRFDGAQRNNYPWNILRISSVSRRKPKGRLVNRADERKGRRKRLALAGRRFRVRDFRIPKKKTDVSIGGAERPRWSTMASNRIYILASRCSRLLITQGSGLGTRVINGSRPRLGYRGTKLRANLPQPYINPDFLSLLSQRGPSLPFSPRPRPNAHARFLWHGTMKRHASYPVPIYSPFPGPPS